MDMLNEIKAEVNHVMKDYYVGAPILSLKQIKWLIDQVEQLEIDRDHWKGKFLLGQRQ